MNRSAKRNMAIAFAVAVSLGLTGCQSKGGMKLAFDEVSLMQSHGTHTITGTNSVEYFSEQLCVVPLGEDRGGDASIQGAASLLFDIDHQQIIYADQIYERIYPASLTKLLTALVVLEEADLSQTVTVSYNASHITEVGAKLCGLKEGDQIQLGDLLTALLVYSGNDAGIAIAEHIAGSEEEFCNRMNEKAKRIGAVDTHVTNSHGLHNDDHYTTAYDLYLIFHELLSFEQAKEIIRMERFTMDYTDASGEKRQAVYQNTNRYLKGEVDAPEGIQVNGGKTGTTNAAGYCLELLVKDASGTEYIALVMKARSSDHLYQEMNTLIGKIK